jgi:hypothetical protein
MEAGDCLFIPSKWYHQVNSFDRNWAVNLWWYRPQHFNAKECKDYTANFMYTLNDCYTDQSGKKRKGCIKTLPGAGIPVQAEPAQRKVAAKGQKGTENQGRPTLRKGKKQDINLSDEYSSVMYEVDAAVHATIIRHSMQHTIPVLNQDRSIGWLMLLGGMALLATAAAVYIHVFVVGKQRHVLQVGLGLSMIVFTLAPLMLLNSFGT